MKKLLTIISLIAIVSLLASVLVMPASAETTTGSCGENVTFAFDSETKELKISGTGPITTTSGWSSFKSSVLSVTIENGVTAIPNSAFSSFSNMESISIPASVQSIGRSAFADCLKLNNVVLPEGLTAIQRSTFGECYALTSIVVPDSVTVIEDSAFSGCGALASIHIGKGVTTIEADAFMACVKLTTINLPATITTIHQSAFTSATKLATVNFYCGNQAQWDAIKAAFKADVTVNFHVNGGNEINKEPTATEDGAIGYVCDVCGEDVILETIPATGEVTEAETTAAATTAAETTAAETTAAAKEGGCGSFLAGGAAVVALTSIVGVAYVTNRKED